MSAGAVFKLIANDGKADRMIMATKLLNQRIKDVMCARKRAGKADITPTLVDLERTHIIFVNAHFKPFAAIGYEYNRVRSQSGQAVLGGGVTFSIPQFGDFFHDMVVRVLHSTFCSNVQVAPTQASGSAGNPSAFPADGEDAEGGALADSFYQLVDAFGNVVAGGGNFRNLVRWCEFPGNRLFQKVKFDVNGNPLDEYDDVVASMIQKFCVPPVKETGYNRLVGQEVKCRGYSGPTQCPVIDLDSTNTPAAAIDGTVPTELTCDGVVVDLTNAASERVDYNRRCFDFVNGPQTPKLVQPPLEIWNKLRFWFNDDARLSIPSVSIPFGQRFISIDLATQNLLTFEFPGLYLQLTIDDGVDRVTTFTPVIQAGTISDVTIDRMELYVNNIFVNPEVHDIFIKRIGFSLIRVYRQHRQRVNQDAGDEQLLSQLKWPIEYMFLCLKPAWNTRAANREQWRDWHRCTRIIDGDCDVPDRGEVSAGAFGDNAAAGGAAALAAGATSSIGQIVHDTYQIKIPTINTLSVTAHGISIFDNFEDIFFNAYMPFHYGGPALRTPEDPGALFINFALFPKSYQPSGHLNISRAREFFVRWTTDYVSANTPADLLAVAIAINFLLITDGSAVLRYST